ncbi:hypothetical protein WH47_08733 [Habropoda laboriosa]|uniref:Uncharacterized protein n=1 Tax=Habropoda laboriosa TaxID=597456 RepID=A0A0L7QPB7_9HYME|nr:hypothetical protein WH47_08733 [Habropoda laboriosa]
MSSPRSLGGSVREGTRVVLREITASLHNSPPMQPLHSATPSHLRCHESFPTTSIVGDLCSVMPVRRVRGSTLRQLLTSSYTSKC